MCIQLLRIGPAKGEKRYIHNFHPSKNIKGNKRTKWLFARTQQRVAQLKEEYLKSLSTAWKALPPGIRQPMLGKQHPKDHHQQVVSPMISTS